VVVHSSHDDHVILGGVHIPKAVGVHSDRGSGHGFGCDWRGPLDLVGCGRNRSV